MILNPLSADSPQLEQLPSGARQVVLETHIRPDEAAPPPGRRFYPNEVMFTGDALILPLELVTGANCCIMDLASWRYGEGRRDWEAEG